MVVGGRCGRFLAVKSGASGGAGSVPALSHVYVIVMENKEYGAIVGSSNAPYLNGLIAKGALATNYRAVAHPSEPNYLALWSGSTQGVTDDGVHNLPGTNIADQLAANGKSWRVFAQNVPARVLQGDDRERRSGRHRHVRPQARAGDQLHRHQRQRGTLRQHHGLQPLHPAAANFELIVPNLCNDMHDCSVATGDTFLSGFVPGILAARRSRTAACCSSPGTRGRRVSAAAGESPRSRSVRAFGRATRRRWHTATTRSRGRSRTPGASAA